MEYLNLVSTRSIILFAPPSPSLRPSLSAKEAQGEFHSPPGSPITPTSALPMTFAQPLPLPQPIAIPLDAFLSGAGARGESDLAYFLIRHILASWAKNRKMGEGAEQEYGMGEEADRNDRFAGRDGFDTRTFGGGPGTASTHRYEPDRTKNAEELAWIEIYKAKTFVNRLGEKWAQGKVGEKEMRGMAKALGLALKERDRERRVAEA